MKNYKNYLIAILTGLLGFSLSIYPSQGAAKKDSPAKLIEYANCLAAMDYQSTAFTVNVDVTLQFDNWVSQAVLNCSTWKPVVVANAKLANYTQCLNMGSTSLKWEFIKPNKNEQFETADLRMLLSMVQEKCKVYRP
jgi:hypothetical protein